ncbi:MAG: M16 family metallopeptidase [Gammaproteobacteria bacterium]
MRLRALGRQASTLRVLIACLSACVLSVGEVALAADTGADTIVTRTLDNGMKIIVWPDHDIPNVALYNYVRAGARNEVPGITGLSHFFEHMMFNGTTSSAPGEFDRTMEANGGSNNAYTSTDLTVYQDWFPGSALEVIFQLEADRLANLSFDPKVVESERGVVTSERRSSVDNSNFGLLYEQIKATAFAAHPYQIPVIGWPSDIASWSIDDLRNYFTTYYAPNNCTLVIVGDVQPDAVFAMAERYLASISAQEPPPQVRTVEPEQIGERRLVLERSVQNPLVGVAYKSPPAAAEEGPALDLLASVLTDGESSRLYRALVETGVALNIDTFRQEGFDPGLMWFFMTLPQGSDTRAAEEVLYNELARIVRDGITDAELARAKRLSLAGFWRGLATINGKAAALGNFEVFHGDYAKLFAAPDQYAAIEAAAVQQAAAAIFDARRRTVGAVVAPAPSATQEQP